MKCCLDFNQRETIDETIASAGKHLLFSRALQCLSKIMVTERCNSLDKLVITLKYNSLIVKVLCKVLVSSSGISQECIGLPIMDDRAIVFFFISTQFM